MKTTAQIINDKSQLILNDLFELLDQHSSFKRWDNGHEPVLFRPMVGDFVYVPLSEKGKQLQSKIHEEFNVFIEVVEVLVSKLPEDNLKTLEQIKAEILKPIIQNKYDWHGDIEQVKKGLLENFTQLISLLAALHDRSDGTPIYVPDTNAFLLNPELENWKFENVSMFEILLLPTVVAELDKFKNDHRSKDFQEKAKGLINRFKEYRRRGNGTLKERVTIVSNKILIRAIAEEPKFDRTLGWLDQSNNDDRIIASFIEVLRQHPRSPATLVTHDLNMHNKADLAFISTVEPPEVTTPQAQ